MTLLFGSCASEPSKNMNLPISCNNAKSTESVQYVWESKNISLNKPTNWAALVDTSFEAFDAILFRDTTYNYYQSSFFATMIYKDIKIPLKEYFELDYNSSLKNSAFTGTTRGQTILNGHECFWQFTHNYSDGHCITLAYYLKDEARNRIIMIPTSTYLVDDYESELCKLHKLIENIKI